MNLRLVAALFAFGILLAFPAASQAAFPGANGKIFFYSERDPSAEIYSMNPDGSNQANVAPLDADIDTDPAVSPDGTKVAFVSNEAGGNFDIYIMDTDGTNKHRLTTSGAFDADPSWSPDGKKIAFTSDRNGPDFDVYTIDASSAAEQNVTPITSNSLSRDAFPAWSPDGTQIAFESGRTAFGGDLDIYKANSDGTSGESLTPLTNDSATPHSDSNPTWSPDGTKIAFQSDRNGDSDIVTMNADGSSPSSIRIVTTNEQLPAWSPDGSRLVFQSNMGGTDNEIVVYVIATAATSILTSNTVVDAAPDWQRAVYPLPVGASPTRVSFVPAYTPCETTFANANHGTPINFPSCHPPQQISTTAAFGPNSIGFARYVVCPVGTTTAFCLPGGGVMPLPDLRITGSIRDVTCRVTGTPPGCVAGGDYNPNTAGGPYTGAGGGTAGATPACFPGGSCSAGADLTLTAQLTGGQGKTVRITDQYDCNPSAPGGSPYACPATTGGPVFPATAQDVDFAVPLDCLPTATAEGSTCGVNTTANALYPGAVVAGRAAVWQLGHIQLRDSGPDGVRGNGDDQLFAVQGFLAP